MSQNEAAAVDPIAGGSFSRLLFSDLEAADDTITLHHHHHHHPTTTAGIINHFTFSTDKKPPKMLCFGAVSSTPDNSTTTTDDNNNNNSSSSPVSITTTTTITSLSSNSNIKRNMGSDCYQPVVLPTTTADTVVPPVRITGRSNKKMKVENTPTASHAKVKKKEKLGERIAALQQMVSPYGKTDTASVLHEAMGYIKFLQEQVQVLCSPYLQRRPPNQIEGEDKDDDDGGGEKRKKELRTRGLCLVPVECTLHVAESNGADLWSPAAVNRRGSSALH